MKTTLFLLASLATAQVYAADWNLRCVGTHNSDKVMDRTLTLLAGQRNLPIGSDDQFEFILSDNGKNVIELQAYNSYEPSRSYATADFSAASAWVELSLWTREFLLEVRCSRL